ncbi:Uncharacterised protein [Aeromonas salmonicida]|nr:Uncharacterised protein [Aeromonas salmonicida]
MVAAQDGAGHGLLFALPQSHRLTDLIGWSVRLEDTGHPNIQAVVISRRTVWVLAPGLLFLMYASNACTL